jgi:hypothetical protein
MSRTSLILGILIAIGVHAALFWPLGKSPAKQNRPVAPRLKLERPQEPAPEPEAQEPEPSEIVSREEAPLPEPAPERATPEPERRAETPPPAPMERVDEVRKSDVETAGLGQTADEPDDDALPPVRILWDGPDEVRSVALELGIRIVAVDRQGDVLGEVARTGSSRIVPFDSGTSRFSNRVRMIDDRDFFGSEIPGELNGRLSAFWLLVPADLDRALSDEIRRTIHDSGYAASEVRYVEASFEQRAGRRVLKIGRIETGAGS